MLPRLPAVTVVAGLLAARASAGIAYPWLPEYDRSHSVEARIPAPPGSRRAATAPDGFATWLRGLPLRPGRPPVRLFDGRLKGDQDVHHAVVHIDVGTKDLQQCADAVIRLRAEYLFAAGALEAITFAFTSGDPAPFSRWSRGERPRVAGRRVWWKAGAPADASHASFRRYLDAVFTYAGSHSLSRELKPVGLDADIEPGDVFIQGGFPGHAVIVIDVAVEASSGRRFFLLAQSYMPAQEVHVLRNPGDPALGPWYPADFGPLLVTPEWSFRRADRRRF